MGNSMDDLLNAIKQEYEDKTVSQAKGPQPKNVQSKSPQSSKEPSQTHSPQASNSSQPSNVHQLSGKTYSNPDVNKPESIDDLLDDLGVSSPASRSASTPASRPASRPASTPFPTVRESSSMSAGGAPSSSFSLPANKTTAIDSVLSQVKQQHAAEEAEQERKRQEALEADRRLQHQLEEQAQQRQLTEERRQRELEEQRKAQHLKKAEEWLKELDPNSEEGFWFESFAVNYPSKLDAALEYLEAMDTWRPL